MRRFDTLLLHTRPHTRLGGQAVALLLSFALTFALTLAVAGSAYGEDSAQVKHQLAIQKILDDNAGNPAGVKDAIMKILGDAQGNAAVLRTQEILDALPADISVEAWETIKAALEERAMQLGQGMASTSISRLIDKMNEGMEEMRIAQRTDTPDRQYSSEMAPPPQTTVVCLSENC
jgi:hypothetical protein